MSRSSYPLEAARSVRQHAVDEAKHALAAAERARQDAEAALIRAQRELEGHQRETQRIRRAELGGIGVQKASELGRALSFMDRRAAEETALRERLADKRQRLSTTADEVARARSALAEARAEEQVVERHREQWVAAERQHAEARAEEEADDRAAARSGRSG